MGKGDFKYSKKHNWAKLKRTVVTIGVTDFFLNGLGDLIDLNLSRVGDEIVYGISYGEIESVNDISDLIAPFNGGVIKVNTDLVAKLKILQKDPFDDGWFIKVRIPDVSQLDALMEEEEYEEYKKSLKRKKKRVAKSRK